jgi:hypothetical protein
MLRYLEGRSAGGPLVARSTVMGVTLNGLTTIVGFGSLMIAAHRGIFSLGLLLTIGSACGLAASLVVLPVVLRLITQTSAPMSSAFPISHSPPPDTGKGSGVARELPDSYSDQIVDPGFGAEV